MVFFFAAAYLRARTELTINNDHIVQYADNKKATMITGVVTEPIIRTGRGGVDFIISVNEVTTGKETLAAEGILLVRARRSGVKVRYGDLVRINGKIKRPLNFNNPGAFDYAGYLKSRGIVATCNVYKSDNITVLKRGYKRGALFHIENFKENVNDLIYSRGFSENKSIVSALLFGGTKQINRYAHELYIQTGTAHILAISGLHMGVVALFFYYLSIFILKRSEWFATKYNIIKLSYLITLIFLILYSVLVGMRVSSVRAVIMIGVFMLAALFDKAQNTLRTMFVAAFLILLFYPASLKEASFMLSFCAVFAILYFYPKLNLSIDRYFERESDSYFKKSTVRVSLIKSVFMVFTLSVIINLVILPVILYNFNYISLSAPLINAIIIPIYSIIIIPMNFIMLMLAPFSRDAAVFVIHINEYIIHLTFLMLRFLARYLNFSIYTATPNFIEIGLYYVFIFSLIKSRERRFKIIASATALLLIVGISYYRLRPRRTDGVTVSFFDVSHGDSALIDFDNGKRMLIDGGGFFKKTRFDVGKDVIAKYLWKNKITKVDYIVSTHPHPDHMRGLFFIADNFSPEKIFIAKHDYTNRLYKDFTDMFKDKIEYVDKGKSSLMIGESTVDFLNYDYGGGIKNNIDVNRSALVLMLEYRGKRILFTADIDKDTERDLIKKGADFKCDVLKAAHHGSDGSSSEQFIKAASPGIAVISVAKDRYFNLPSPTTIKLFTDNNIKVLRTDRDGMITVHISDKGISFLTFTGQ